jgi:hypothetical protein
MRVMQHRKPAAMPATAQVSTTEISIDLTARELPGPPAAAGDESLVEVNDICEVDPLLRTGSFAAHASAADSGSDSVEIELTAEQMEAMLDSQS